MNGQKKQLVVLLFLFVVCAAAYFGLKAYNADQTEKEKKKTEDTTITAVQVAEDTVTAFSYQVNGSTLTFEKEGDTWYYQPDHSIFLDQNSIESMLSAVSKVTAAQQLEEDADGSAYGFDTPLNVLTFQMKQGEEQESYTVTIGMKNEITGQYYVKNSGSDRIYLTDTDLNSAFSKNVENLKAAEDTEE